MSINADEFKDRILLKRACQKRCPEATQDLYIKYKPFITNYIRSRLYRSNDHSDLVQTVFAHICQGKCNYDGTTSPRGYLCGIAKNVIRAYLTASQTQIRTSSLDSIDIDGDLVLKHNSPSSPLNDLYRKELRQALKYAIANLPPKSRQAVELVYIHRLKPAQAAAHSNREIIAFYNSLQYGLTKIKAELQNLQKNF